jgi:methionyl-tRNA formyltransferase
MPQDPALVSLAPEPVEAHLRADFSWSTERVLRRIRALSPVPGLGLTLADVVFFVTRAHPTSGFVAALEPGEAEVAQDRLILRTGDGAISVESAALATDSEEVEVLTGAELAHLLGERLKATRGSSFKGGRG